MPPGIANGSAPPPLWQSDVLQNITNTQELCSTKGSNSSLNYDPVQLSETYRSVVLRQASDRRDNVDLYDLLANARREETYQPYFQGWPSLLRPLSPTMSDMPAMVQEKYRACQTMCFCGLFPQIQHAWASIDNSLYLWRYNRSGDVPVEYCGEEQAICAVGLVTPRQGVFLEAIQHLLVLCTTTEIVLLGVCVTKGSPAAAPPGGNQPASGDISSMLSTGTLATPSSGKVGLALQPLPMYSVPSDNVVMTCVTGTATGRIFMGGSDGQLYELHYAAADSWTKKRCFKVRHTGRIQQLLPSFIPSMFGYGSTGAIERVVVDDARHILYTLSPPGHIQVFDLGSKGNDRCNKVAEITDFYQAAANANGGRDVFRNAAADKKAAVVKYITPISPAESSKLHLLAITADGRRVYLTTYHVRSSYYNYNTVNASGVAAGQQFESPRPTTLMAMFARQAAPHVGVSASRAPQMTGGASLEVVTAHYSYGTLLLTEAAGSDGRATSLLMATRNTTLPLASTLTAGSSTGGAQGLRELLAQLDSSVPGEACAIEALPGHGLLETLRTAASNSGGPSSVPGPQEELFSQLFSPPPRYVLISTAGVIELEKRRPMDVLAALLEERNSVRVSHFFEAFGATESASMCLALACATPGTYSSVVVEGAAACLDNTSLVGEPRMPQDVVVQKSGGGQQEAAGGGAGGTAGAASNAGVGASTGLGFGGMNIPTATGSGIYMGQAVNPHPEPEWSAGHKGLCLYVLRLLSPVWEVKVTMPSGSGASALLQPRLPRNALEVIDFVDGLDIQQ